MKKLDNKLKDYLYLGYRLVNPIFDPLRLVTGSLRYPKYLIDLYKFSRLGGIRNKSFLDLYPVLDEGTKYTAFDSHYFYQQLWVFRHVNQLQPDLHVDVGSSYQMSGYLSEIVKTEFVDIRPISATKDNLKVVEGNILNLPYETNSLESVSCLHVLEHIGLGRYDKKLFIDGLEQGLTELIRVTKPGGRLYASTPVGKPRVCFNAHRVSDPEYIVNIANNMELIQFCQINDNGEYLNNSTIGEARNYAYGLGMFLFQKKKEAYAESE